MLRPFEYYYNLYLLVVGMGEGGGSLQAGHCKHQPRQLPYSRISLDEFLYLLLIVFFAMDTMCLNKCFTLFADLEGHVNLTHMKTAVNRVIP